MTFAELCKKHRARSGLFLADQAEALGVSVSLVSAVETGKRNVPEGYPERVAIWLHLNRQESDELLGSAAASSNVIKFKPKDHNRAKFASELSRRLNELSNEELEQIRSVLDQGEKAYV